MDDAGCQATSIYAIITYGVEFRRFRNPVELSVLDQDMGIAFYLGNDGAFGVFDVDVSVSATED